MNTPAHSSFRTDALERLQRWSKGQNSLDSKQIRRLGTDAEFQGKDLAVLDCFEQVSSTLHKPITPELLNQISPQQEHRYADRLRRLHTPSPVFARELPDSQLVRQGTQPDCVLTATSISLAARRPEALAAILEDCAEGVKLHLPGEEERMCARPTPRELLKHSCAYESGTWMTVLSKELGPIGGLNPAQAIKTLTGRKADLDVLLSTDPSITRQKMELAQEKGAVVIAGRSGLDKDIPGLTRNHAYAVVDYNPAFVRVRLQDPEGNEPRDDTGKPLDGKLDGRFSVSLSDFHSWFSSVHYERVDEPPFWGGLFDKIKDAFTAPSTGGRAPVTG